MPVTTGQLAQLHDDVAAIGPLRTDFVEIPDTGEIYEITRPDDFDVLLDRAADDPEQNLPYWAELWPSGIALAAELLNEAASLEGVRALELGAGLGVTAIAALQRGMSLLVTDYSPETLALCAFNTARNAGQTPVAMRLNWRKPEPEFLQLVGEGFPLVLAADVLYEERDVSPLRELVERIVAPRGMLWLAEPGRPPARRFVDEMTYAGWTDQMVPHLGPWPDPEDNKNGVMVRVHRMKRG